MNTEYFQKRIGWNGNLKILLELVCKSYNLGEYLEHEVVKKGYEDLNIILTTNKGKYFVKVFANFRDFKNCKRYVDIMRKVISIGIRHPKLLKSLEGYLTSFELDSVQINLCVMEYIVGKSLYELGEVATLKEVPFIVKQASLINSLNIKLPKIYDSWAIENFLGEFKKKKMYLMVEEREIIEGLSKKFKLLQIEKLPHCFVHSDIIKTNVIKTNTGDLYVLDFSVASQYARIQELAVLLCNLFFNEKDIKSFDKYLTLTISEYNKHIKLTKSELKALPIYVQVAHAMHIICPTFEKVANGNDTKENEYWLNMGRVGLKFTSELWKDYKI